MPSFCASKSAIRASIASRCSLPGVKVRKDSVVWARAVPASNARAAAEVRISLFIAAPLMLVQSETGRRGTLRAAAGGLTSCRSWLFPPADIVLADLAGDVLEIVGCCQPGCAAGPGVIAPGLHPQFHALIQAAET